MTESVDPRLVALGLVPPPATAEQRDVEPAAPREAAPLAPPPLAAQAPTATLEEPTDTFSIGAPAAAQAAPFSRHAPIASLQIDTGTAVPAERVSVGVPASEPALPPSALLLSETILLLQGDARGRLPGRLLADLAGVEHFGFPTRALELSLEQRGFRINAKQPIEVPWSEVVDIRERRGHVAITTATRHFVFDVPIDGVAEPEVAGPLARVIQEASGGSLSPSGSAYLELQRAADLLRDRFHEEDDPLIPSLVGLAVGLSTAVFIMLLPVALLLVTRPAVPSGAFLIAPRLSSFDPRVVLIALGAAALLASLVVRLAIGRHGAVWARGTLRGWHVSRKRFLDAPVRRALAVFVQYPVLSAALLLGGLLSTLPSTRPHVIVDAAGVHVTGALPFFDEDRSWGTVTGIETIPAMLNRHYGGIAVVFHFANRAPVNTVDDHVWGGTDGQLFEFANLWRGAAR